jgi:hypothetical protein
VQNGEKVTRAMAAYVAECRAAANWFLLNLRANRLVILGSNHCKCLLNQQLLSDSMTTAQRLSQKTR